MPDLQQCRRRDVIPQARRPGHPSTIFTPDYQT